MSHYKPQLSSVDVAHYSHVGHHALGPVGGSRAPSLMGRWNKQNESRREKAGKVYIAKFIKKNLDIMPIRSCSETFS